MSVNTGDRFSEKDRPAQVWEVMEVRLMIGRPHARLRSLADATRMITLAVSVLEDRRAFKRLSPIEANAA